MYFPEIKQKAIKLRKDGYSYNYIIKYVPVAKSTLSDWLHDIPFTPNKHTIETIGNAHIASGNYKHQVKVESLEKAGLQAKKDIGILLDRDIMMLGLGVYIGEGGKTGNITRIINSDSRVIRLILNWFKLCFGIKSSQFAVRLHLYPDNDIDKCIEYWSNTLKIPRSQFFKSMIDRRKNKKKKNNKKLPYGTAHVSVKSFGKKEHGAFLLRRIMAWINIVLC